MSKSRKSSTSSPVLDVQITPEGFERAVRSASGGCLIADAIKDQHPAFSKVAVDMATIRVSDAKTGKRYIYLTPPAAQHLLLSFDQGWPKPPIEDIRIRRAVQIVPVRRAATGPHSRQGAVARRQERIAALEAKQRAGQELSAGEKVSLGMMRNAKPAPERPTSPGPREVHVTDTGVVIHGGKALPHGGPHPNLLRGRDRHFGAKLADPGQAFQDAVDAAVAERLGTPTGDMDPGEAS